MGRNGDLKVPKCPWGGKQWGSDGLPWEVYPGGQEVQAGYPTVRRTGHRPGPIWLILLITHLGLFAPGVLESRVLRFAMCVHMGVLSDPLNSEHGLLGRTEALQLVLEHSGLTLWHSGLSCHLCC